MLRSFTDSTGVEWRVWEVFPSKATDEGSAELLSHSSLRHTVFAQGWLCFESATEKRRLAPIPGGWAFLDLPRLDQLREQATLVPIRRQHRSTPPAA